MEHLHHENRAKTSCSAPTNSRSPSQHRSRSVSTALRQASVLSSDPSGSGLTIGPNAWLKRKLHLRPQHRGVHLVTEEILAGLPELAQFQVGYDKLSIKLQNGDIQMVEVVQFVTFYDGVQYY